MTRDKERTKREILEALEAVLVEEGYERIGVNHVAKRSCHSKELIYRYFGSMDGLMKTFSFIAIRLFQGRAPLVNFTF